ncbi:hypothetical protein C8R45DRAFT_922990 [Mycena sanguinolenta]|nr:hypothetical protein C8R45DRAFT_922990 [Mycena sanguinolenta]
MTCQNVECERMSQGISSERSNPAAPTPVRITAHELFKLSIGTVVTVTTLKELESEFPYNTARAMASDGRIRVHVIMEGGRFVPGCIMFIRRLHFGDEGDSGHNPGRTKAGLGTGRGVSSRRSGSTKFRSPDDSDRD